MARLAILRLVRKRLEAAGVSRVKASILGPTIFHEVKRYRVTEARALLQPIDMVEVVEVARFRIDGGRLWREYCRWHSGPIDHRDDPRERIYCGNRVAEGQGYCREHRRSERALYEYCMSMSGSKALEACKVLDSKTRLEYALYMLDKGDGKPKVGVTRSFRLLERIAEQPHTVATLLHVFDSAYQARKAEMLLSRDLGIATEKGARKARYTADPGRALARIRYVAEKAAKLLGIRWEESFFRVDPPELMKTAKQLEQLKDTIEVDVKAYWGGFLVVNAENLGILSVKDRRLLHKDGSSLV